MTIPVSGQVIILSIKVDRFSSYFSLASPTVRCFRGKTILRRLNKIYSRYGIHGKIQILFIADSELFVDSKIWTAQSHLMLRLKILKVNISHYSLFMGTKKIWHLNKQKDIIRRSHLIFWSNKQSKNNIKMACFWHFESPVFHSGVPFRCLFLRFLKIFFLYLRIRDQVVTQLHFV